MARHPAPPLNVRDAAHGWQRDDPGILTDAADFWRPFGYDLTTGITRPSAPL